MRQIDHLRGNVLRVAVLDDVVDVKVLALEPIKRTLQAITRQQVVRSLRWETGNINSRRKEVKIRWKYSKMREGSLVSMQNLLSLHRRSNRGTPSWSRGPAWQGSLEDVTFQFRNVVTLQGREVLVKEFD